MACYKSITVELSGGCELLFGKESTLRLDDIVPLGTSINGLVQILKTEYLKERPDLLVDQTGTTIRPGILVLVNTCDAEVVGGLDYVLEEGDIIELISTLHGG